MTAPRKRAPELHRHQTNVRLNASEWKELLRRTRAAQRAGVAPLTIPDYIRSVLFPKRVPSVRRSGVR